MTSIGRVDGLVIDGADTMGLARFWAGMFDTEIASIANEGEPNEAQYVDVAGNGDTPLLRFQRVPEGKAVKNRLHLDIEVEALEPAIARVKELGGVVIQPVRTEYGYDFAIMGDPEGNEFCLIRPVDRAPTVERRRPFP
jgi:predicted enzyme related to lactoylglutathione lyase